MGQKLSDWLYQVSTGWVALFGLFIFIAFLGWVLPDQAARSEEAYTEGVGSPDSSFYYTASDLYQIAEAYGAEGREAYVRDRFGFDVIWPLAYTLFLATAVSWLFGKLTFGKVNFVQGIWQRINLCC